jgi:hypothetical protein
MRFHAGQLARMGAMLERIRGSNSSHRRKFRRILKMSSGFTVPRAAN